MIRNMRWYIVGLLFLSTVINYVDRQVLPLAILHMSDRVNMSYAHIVTAFLVAYTIMQVGAGRVIDWLGTRRGMAVFVSWWSVAGILTATAVGVPALAAFRFLLGVGEAGNWPGAVKAIAEWFPARERALAAGIFNSGSSIGAVIAPLAIVPVIVRFGWQSAFVLTGSLGLIWLLAWLWLYRAPENGSHLSRDELAIIRDGDGRLRADHSASIPWMHLFRYRQLWGVVVCRLLSDPVWWFYATWMPKYLREDRAFSLALVGRVAWVPFLTAGIGGFAGGAASSLLIRRGWDIGFARKSVLCASAALMAAGIPAAKTPSAAVSIAFMSVATFAYASFAANLIALVTDVFPKGVMASVYGIAGTAAGLGGIAFTEITGVVTRAHTYAPIFIAAGVLPIVAAFLLVGLLGRVRQIGVPASARSGAHRG